MPSSFSVGFVRWHWVVCLGVILSSVSACSKPSTPENALTNEDAVTDVAQNLLSYQPLADKLQEIFTAAYDPGPIATSQYERMVQELAEAADQRKPFGPDSGVGEWKLEEMVTPLVASHQATLSAAKNLAEDSELIQKYRDGETLPENAELAEAVARAFPDGAPPRDELGAMDKFNAANAMIDVKWEHVHATRTSSQAFLDAFKQLKKEALLIDSE